MERNENLQKVYTALKNEGYTDIGDFNSFSSMMSDSNNVRKVYDGLLVSGYTDLGDFDTFKRNVYQSSVSLGDYKKVAEETHDAQEPQIEDGNRFGILGKMGKYMGSPSAYIPTPQVVEKKEPAPEELQQMQDAAKYREDLRTELQDSGAIDSMKDAKKEARQSKFKALGEMLAYTPQTSMAGISSSTFSEPDVTKAVEAGREFTQNKLMESTLNEALDMARQGEKNLDGSYAVGDFARGVWDEAVDISTWDMGYSDLVNAATLNQLVQKYESDRDNLTATEKKVLEALGMSAAVQEAYAGTTGIAYGVGQSIPHSAAFIGQMAFNPAKGAGEALAKAAIKKVGKQGVMSTVGNVGTRLLTEVLETGVMTATTGAGRVAADALERINGRTEYSIDNDGYIVYGGQTDNETVRNAWWKAFGATFIEGYTESLGRAVFDPALDALKSVVGGKLKKGSLNKLGEIMLGEEPSRLAEAMRVLKSAGKVDSMVGELLEEEVGMIINALTVGDQSLDPKDPNFVFNLENQLTTLISTALMTGTINAAEAAGDYFTRRDINKKANDAEKVCRALYGEGWDAMRDKMDSSTPEEAVQMLSGIMQDPAIEQRKKAAMLEYASKRITAQYFNAEDEKVRESLVKEKRELHDAFNAGLEARLPDFYNMRKAVDGAKTALDEYGEKNNRMEEINAAIRGINESPEKMNEILSGMPEEEQNLIRDYVYSRTRMNGAYVGRSNKLEDYVDEFAFAVEPFVVTNENGDRTITTANLDRVSGSIPVYVMRNDGTNAWVMREDGSSNMVLTKELKNIFTKNAEDVIEAFRQQATETMDAETENAVKHHPKTQSPRVGLVLTNTDGTQMVVTEMVEGGMKIAPAVFKDGQYLPKGGAATQTITTEQAYGWQDLYNQKQDEKTSFKIGTEQTFHLKGKAVKGVITGIGPDGNYNVDLEEDVEGYDKVGSYTLSQMREMTTPPTRTINMLANQSQNEGTSSEEIKQSVSEEVANSQIEDNVTEPTAEVVESVNTALSRVPKDAKGNPLYEQTDADTAWDAIVEETGGDAEMAQRIAEEMVADKKAALTKMQKGKPKKGATVAEKIANEKAHIAAIAQAEQEVAAWEKIAQTEARRRDAAMSEADRYAAEMEQKNISEGLSALGEPQSLQEYVLAQLAGGAYKLRWNDKENGTKGFGSHTGLSTEEMKARLSMVNNKNGLTPEEIAHSIVENMDASFGEVDAMDVTDMVIDAVSTYASRRAMLNGLVESRAELLRQQEIAEQEAKDAWYMEQYHAAEEELAAYNEYLAEFAEEIYGEDSDYEQRIATFAEIQLEYDNQGTDAGLRSSADQGEGLASDREGGRSVGETEQLDRREVFADAAGVAEAEDDRAGSSVSAQSDGRAARIAGYRNLSEAIAAEGAGNLTDEEVDDIIGREHEDDERLEREGPVYTEERLDNGDVRITGARSNGEVASVSIERNGKVIQVDTYEDGALFERTDYDENGNATKVTRYNDGEVVSEQEYKDGKRPVTANYFEMAEEAQRKRKSKKKKDAQQTNQDIQEERKEGSATTGADKSRPNGTFSISYYTQFLKELFQNAHWEERPSEEVAGIIRRHNAGKTLLARTEDERELLSALRALTNNEIQAELSNINDALQSNKYTDEEKEELKRAKNLITRFVNRGERNAVIEVLTGAKLGEKLPLSKIDELFEMYNSDANVAELYARVRAIAEQIGLDFWFEEMEDRLLGGYLHSDNRVRLNAHMLYCPRMQRQGVASTIVHEMLHAVAGYAVYTQKDIKLGLTPKVQLSKQVLSAANTIINIYEKAVKGNPALVHQEYDIEKEEWVEVADYGTTSVHEMLSEISNPEFRDKLKQLEYNGRSVWQRIWDALKSMFTQSSDVTNPTAYDSMAKALDVLINEFSVDAYQKYSGLEESAMKLSADENLRFREKEEPKELIAVHNISEGNLKKVLEAGSLIMPSIAITKADMGHDIFGEISLLFDKSTINPFDRRNKVYGGDAWTPRFPRIGVKLNDKVVSRIYKKAYELIDDRRLREIFSLSSEVYPDNIEKVISDYGVEGYYNKEWMKLAYLLDNGKKVKIPTKAKDYGIASEDIVRLAKEKGLSVNEIYEDYDFYKNNPDFVTQVKEARDEARLSSIPEEQRDEMRERMQSRPLSEAAFDSYIRGALEMEKDLANGGLKEVVDRQALRDLIEKKVKTDNAEYNKWVDNLFEGIVEKRGIRNNRDWYTPSGNLRPWGQLYDPATPANILKHMLAENEQGGSGDLFDSNIMGASAETYESIEEIRKKGHQRLKKLSYEEYDEWSNSVAERMAKICDDFLSPTQKNSIGGDIDAKIEITNAVAKDKTAKSIYKYMKREYPNFTMEHAKQVEEIVKEIQESTTEYFEAKPQRLVSVNEVMAAVVPSNASKEIVDALKSNGIEVVTYKKGDEEARKRVVKRVSSSMDIRFRDGAPFFSNAERAVEYIKQQKATPDQWLAMIKKDGGLKAGEDKWMGLSDWLNEQKEKGVKTLTKDEVLQFIRENQIEIEEVEYDEENGLWEKFKQSNEGHDAIIYQMKLAATEYAEKMIESETFDDDEDYSEAYDMFVDEYMEDDLYYDAAEDEVHSWWLENRPDSHANTIDSTRLDYTTEGLENKKEIAFVVPTIEPWNQSDEIHFGDAGEGRAVAWVRFGETTDADGKRVLVIDEVQSKRHDEGRSKGYRNPRLTKLSRRIGELSRMMTGEGLSEELYEELQSLKEEREKLLISNNPNLAAVDNELEEKKARLEELRKRKETEDSDALLEEMHELRREVAVLDKRWSDEMNNAERAHVVAVHDAPFDKNYHELVMKRMLRYAAENGFDKVAWTKGAQQSERYGLGHYVNSLKSEEGFKEDGSTDIYADDEHICSVDEGGIVIDGAYKGLPLSEVVGVEPAKKLLEGKDVTLTGNELHLGGEGMKGFYDEMIPRFMNKYVKKWGAKVGEVTLPEVEEAGRTMWSVDVTPEMKESVMQGQPMFREGMGAVSDREVSYENDPIAKWQGKPRYYGKRAAAFAERERARIQNGAEEAAKILGLDVEIITDASTLQGRKAKAKGWYDINSKKVVVVVPNHVSIGDVVRTVLHEGIAHHGLRELFGDGFNAMLDNIYNNVAPELKARIDAIAERTGVSASVATEEYLASLAEETNFEEAKNRGWWSKIKQFFVDMLNKLSMPGLNLKEELTDNELRYLLWRSYQNLVDPNSYMKPLGYLDDVAKQKELKVGEYAENTMVTPRVAEMSEAEEWSAITMQRIEELEAQAAQLENEIADMEADRDADDASRYNIWEQQIDPLREQLEDVYAEIQGLYDLEAEDEDIEDYEAEREAEKQRQLYQKRIDNAYLKAVREGNWEEATDLFRQYVLSKAEDEGIVPMDYGVGYRGGAHSSIAKKVKEENPDAIAEAAYQMSIRIPKGSILVPMPSRTGNATYTVKLAEAIAKATDSEVRDVLKGKARMSVYEAKQKGIKMTPEDLGMYTTEEMPKGKNIVIIDNVIDKGTTALAAVSAVKGASVVAYAYTLGDKQRAATLKLADPVTYDDNKRIIPLSQRFDKETDDIRYRLVDDQAEIDRLESEPTIKAYRAMQVINGELYPPMSAVVDGKLREPIALGRWEQSEERPDLADDNGRFKLDKGNKKSLKAAYNPYFHSSSTPLNDQFSEAQDRDNLVTVEVEIPVSEADGTSGYKAEKAKDAVGTHQWKAGIIQGQLTGTREVFLTRWDKPIRIVPESEVADVIVEMFDGKDIVMPSNVVTPQLRNELESRGITFVETDNQGKLVEGERKGEHYSKVYGKKAESRLRYRGESLYTPQELAQMETPIYKSKGGFKNLAEAEAWAKENLQGQTRTNQFTGDEISVNRKSVNEMLAPKFSKRVSEDVHMKALQSVLDFIETGIPAEVHKDTHGRDFDVMRLYNAIDIDGKVYRVKSTVRKVKEGDKYYTYEVQKMELIEDTQEALGLLNTNDGGQLNSTNSISGAKLLKGVKKTNSNEEILPSDENIRNDAEIIAEVERESAALGVPVRIVRSVDELPDEDTRKRAVDGQLKGYFDPRTGEVVVYESNTNDANDAKRTILHETVGHKGLRQLIGEERYDKAMVQLMYMLPSEVRDAVLRRAERHGWNAAIAMDEDLADQAERDVQPTWWGKVNAKIRALLRNMGFNVMLTDADVTYLLWRSRKKLMGDTAFDMATNAILKQAARKSAEADAWNEQAFKDAEMRDFEKGAMQRLRNRIGDAQNEYDSAMKTMAFKQRESWQDSMRSLKVFMDVVSKESGKKIADFENAYMYENAMSSTNLMEMQMFRHDVYGRLLKAIHELMESGAKYEEVVDYMMAKHGLERNEKMARAEAEEKVQRWKEKAVEEMQAKAAEELEKQNQRNAIIEAGAKSAYKVKKQRLKGQLERGTISEAQYDHYMQMAEEAYQNELATMKTTHPVDVIAEVEKINTKAEQKLNEYWADHRDYSGLTALTGKDGVAEAESDAMQMVSDFEAKHNTDLLWDETRACTQTILNISHDAGILSDKVYDELWDQYEYYIPLRGFDETTAEEVYTYVGDSKSPYNAPIKTAKGRKSKADDPIATIATMAESAIVEANRNRLKQRFLYMVERHRTELASVSSVWVEKDPITGDCVARFANIPNDATPEEAAQAQKAFEERMEQLHEQEPERYYKASEKPSIPYRVEKKANEHEHQVIVKRNGKDVVITINGDPRVAQAINGLTNPEAAKGFDKFSGNVNRFLSANFTTRNPAFVVSNFVRDGFYTNSMVWAKESPAYAWKYNQNWAKATKLLPSLVSKYKRYEKGDKSALDMSDPVDRAFYEFMINGGETGYTVINSVEDYKGIVAGDLKTMQGGVVGNTKKAVKAVGEVLDTFGRWAEDTSRFAAFLTSREMGRSVTKSIWDAKEISVNFNKKGSGRKMTQHDKGLNSILGWMSQQGRNLYVFWNAGMQGLYNFGKAVKEHPGKMAGLTGVYFGLGMAIAAIFGGHDDDEDYWNLPEYVRRNNICFRVGNKFVTLPLPIELRAIYGMGELAMSWMAGKEDPKKVGMKVVQQISQVMPIDMMADGGGLKAFVPSWVKPIYEVGVNTDWTGMPIYRERTPWNEYDPQWMLAFKSTSPELVAASRAINEATNKNLPSGKENKYDRGWADIEYLNNPAAWEHIAEGYLGGLATMFNQTKKSAMAIWNEDLREVRNIPVVSRFVKDAGEKSEEYALREDYFNAKGVVDELRSQRGHFRKESIDPSLTEEQRKDVMDSRIEMEKMANATISQWNSLENARKKLEDMVNDNPDQEVTFDGKKGKAKDALDEVTRRMVKLTEGYQ